MAYRNGQDVVIFGQRAIYVGQHPTRGSDSHVVLVVSGPSENLFTVSGQDIREPNMSPAVMARRAMRAEVPE